MQTWLIKTKYHLHSILDFYFYLDDDMWKVRMSEKPEKWKVWNLGRIHSSNEAFPMEMQQFWKDIYFNM